VTLEVRCVTILFSVKLSQKDQQRLKENYPDQVLNFYKNMKEAKQYIQEAEILVTYGADLTSELIEQADHLKWIMVLSAGIDKLPLKAIQKKDILITNARGIHKKPMAEYAISMLLQVYRQEKLLMQMETNKEWTRRSIRIQEISGKTMVIAGTGSIGQEVARLSKAFFMKTYGVSKSGRPTDFFDKTFTTDEMDRILPEADFLVSVLPSTDETKGLLTFDHFKLMPEHAVFLNMGRGDLVTSEDILKAVQDEEIAHVILDVFEEEPLPADHPIWAEENITVTPHISGVSNHYLSRALEIFEKNLSAYLDNSKEFLNTVDISKGY